MLRSCAISHATSRINSQVLQRFSTYSTHYAKSNNIKSQAKIMGKLFGDRVSGSKKHWYPTSDNNSSQRSQQSAIFSPTSVGIANKREGKSTTRRMTVLNKLFMKHITDLLATGEASEKIIGRGLQVVQVKISPDFAYVNVYWISDVSEDSDLEQELHRCSGILRHELSQLCLMGEVPRIKFVRDKKYFNLAQVESILRTMDFGEDYEKSELADEIKRDLHLKPNKETVENSQETNVEDNDLEQPVLLRLPEMRHDVLGLDHRNIMFKILTKMRKSKQAWELHEQGKITADSKPIDSLSLEQINKKLADAEASSEEFNKFLTMRRERKNTPERKKFHKEEKWLETSPEVIPSEHLLWPQGHSGDDDFIYEDEVDKKL